MEPEKPNYLRNQLKKIFNNVKPSWLEIFKGDLKKIMNKCMKKLYNTLLEKGVTEEWIKKNGIDLYIRPGIENLLEPFKYFEVSELKTIIIGQDPYVHYRESNGLAFGCDSDFPSLPPSLQMILKCLKEQKYISQTPANCDLKGWAQQGVLLLNRYLSRNPEIKKNAKGNISIEGSGVGTKKYYHEFWEELTDAIIQRLMIEPTLSYFSIVLWGKKAQQVLKSIPDNITAIPYYKGGSTPDVDIFQWGHPSPRSTINNHKETSESFYNCASFKEVNEGLIAHNMSQINWSKINMFENKIKKNIPKPTKPIIVSVSTNKDGIVSDKIVVAATDGNCLGNGKNCAIGAYGVHFPKEFNTISVGYGKNVDLCGLVQSTIYGGSEFVKITNNRAELLGFIKMIEYYNSKLIDGIINPIIGVLDSEYVIKIINFRLWKWKQSSAGGKLNMDLIDVIYDLLVNHAKKINPQANTIKEYHYTLIQPTVRKESDNINNVMLTGWKGITLLHQNSHLKEEDIDEDSLSQDKYRINDKADKLAKSIMEDLPEEEHIVKEYD